MLAFVLRVMVVVLGIALIAPLETAAAPPPRNPLTGEPKNDARTSAAFELPALILTPVDVDEPGFGVTGSRRTTIESDANTINTLLGGSEDDLDDVIDQISEAGWSQGFSISMAVASGDDPSVYATTITNFVYELGDENGAEEYYDLLRDANAASEFRKASGGETAGDQSTYTRWSGQAADGRPLNYLDVVFRSGNVVGEIYIADYSEDRPEIDTIVAMASAVVERIENADEEPGPGLSMHAMFLDGEAVAPGYGYYNRLDEKQIPAFGRAAADSRRDDTFYRDAGVLDVFISSQTMSLPDDGFLDYMIYLYRFNDDDNAAAAVATWADNWESSPTTGYSDVKIVRRATAIGDASETLTHVFTLPDDTEIEGYRVFFQVDDLVVSIIVNSSADVSLDLAEEIFEAASECVADDGPCDAFELTEDQLLDS